MAKLRDKLYNRVIEGDLTLEENELKQVDSEVSKNEAVAWADEMKEHIDYDEDNQYVTVNGLFVDDNLILSDDCYFYGILEHAFNDDDHLIFPSLTDQAGKVVKVNADENGFEYGEVSGGTKLYKHTLEIVNDTDTHYVIVISTRSTAYSDKSQFTDVVSVIPNSQYGCIFSINPTYGMYVCDDMGNSWYAWGTEIEISDTVTPL